MRFDVSAVRRDSCPIQWPILPRPQVQVRSVPLVALVFSHQMHPSKQPRSTRLERLPSSLRPCSLSTLTSEHGKILPTLLVFGDQSAPTAFPASCPTMAACAAPFRAEPAEARAALDPKGDRAAAASAEREAFLQPETLVPRPAQPRASFRNTISYT